VAALQELQAQRCNRHTVPSPPSSYS
jgi:hypothetical protein